MIFKFELGDRVKDKTGGFEGTIVARTEFLYGCIRYSVSATKDNDIKEFGFDEDALELKSAKKPAARVAPRTGGARADTPRATTPERRSPR